LIPATESHCGGQVGSIVLPLEFVLIDKSAIEERGVLKRYYEGVEKHVQTGLGFLHGPIEKLGVRPATVIPRK